MMIRQVLDWVSGYPGDWVVVAIASHDPGLAKAMPNLAKRTLAACVIFGNLDHLAVTMAGEHLWDWEAGLWEVGI